MSTTGKMKALIKEVPDQIKEVLDQIKEVPDQRFYTNVVEYMGSDTDDDCLLIGRASGQSITVYFPNAKVANGKHFLYPDGEISAYLVRENEHTWETTKGEIDLEWGKDSVKIKFQFAARKGTAKISVEEGLGLFEGRMPWSSVAKEEIKLLQAKKV